MYDAVSKTFVGVKYLTFFYFSVLLEGDGEIRSLSMVFYDKIYTPPGHHLI